MILRKIFTLIFLSIFICCEKIDDREEKPNIILIVADDLGWSDMSYMGSKYYETPNICIKTSLIWF